MKRSLSLSSRHLLAVLAMVFVSCAAPACLHAQYNTTKKTTSTYEPPPPPPRSTPPPPPVRSAPAPERTYPQPAPVRSTPAPAPERSYTPQPANNNGGGNNGGGYRPAPNNSGGGNNGGGYRPAPNNSGGGNNGGGYRPAPTNTQPAHTYTPGASSSAGGTAHTYTPGASGSAGGTAHTYTPGATSGSSSAHTYTPGASTSSGAGHTYTPSSGGVTSANGTTTYTPHAAASSGGSSAGSASSAHIYAPSAAGHTAATGSAASLGTHPSVAQLNSVRSGLRGANAHPLPAGQVTSLSHGGYALKTADGRRFTLRGNGTVASYSAHGTTAALRPDGRIMGLHTANLSVARSPKGARTVVLHQPGHGMIVSRGRGAGFVQKPVMIDGRPGFRRTYINGAHPPFVRGFSPYTWHGMELAHYQPEVVFAPAFYGYAYYPWGAPVAYGWPGYVNAAILGFYQGYFGFDPNYATPADFLTDSILADTLEDAYDDQQQPDDGGGEAAQDTNQDPDADAYASQDNTAPAPVDETLSAPQDTPITPQLKHAIATQVQQQIGFENAATQQPDQAATLTDLPQVMQPNYIFVVDSPTTVYTAEQMGCYLGAGDVITLLAVPAAGDAQASVIVSASRRQDCPVGTQVGMGVDVLQEMQNSFRARLNAGLVTLHDQQGQNGLPAAPASAMSVAPKHSSVSVSAAAAADAQASIQAAQKQADTSEVEVAHAAGWGPKSREM